MKLRGVNGAQEELDDALVYIKAMEKAKSFREYRSAWKHYLFASNRIYNRLSAGCKGDPFDIDWIELKRAQRAADPLLNYINHARHTAEHGLMVPIAQMPGSFGITGGHYLVNGLINVSGPFGFGPGSNLSITNLSPENPIEVEFKAPSVILTCAVDDRFPNNAGNTVCVPTEHLGNPIKDTHPTAIAKLAVKYFECLVSEAQKRLP